MVRKKPWDLVLLDLSMPVRNGQDVLTKLMESRLTMPVLIVMTVRTDRACLVVKMNLWTNAELMRYALHPGLVN